MRSVGSQHLSLDTSAVQRFGNGLATAHVRQWLGTCIKARRLDGLTPVVQRLRDMNHAICLLCHPQKQIEVLRPVEFRPKSADLIDQTLPDNQQMRNVVVA